MKKAHNQSPVSVNTSTTIPATSLQLGMLFHALSANGSGVDIEQIQFDIDASLRLDAFRDAWQLVISRHAILRASFTWSGGDEPRLALADTAVIPITTLDWSSVEPAGQAERLLALRHHDRRSDFVMDVVPLMRLSVIDLGGGRTTGLWTFHHALLDGRSFPIVLNEVFAAYDGASLPDLTSSTSFEVFARHLNEQPLHDHQAFWTDRLKGFDEPSDVKAPYDHQPDNHHGSVVEFRLSTGQTQKLRQFASRSKVTLNTLVQAAWGLVVHHWSQKDDVVFGVIRACRHALPGTTDSIGLLINTVPLRIQFSADLVVAEYLNQVRQAQMQLRPFETTPLHRVQQWSPTPNDASLFNSIVMYDEATLTTRMSQGDASAKGRYFSYTGQTNFPLTLLAYGDSKMLMRLEYDCAQFSFVTADKLLAQVVQLMLGFEANEKKQALKVPYLSEAEAATLMRWNASKTDYRLDTTLAQLLEQQVSRTPNAIALVFGEQTLTYAQFNARVNQVAHRLIRLGVVADSIVGVYAERSIDMLVAIHGAVKAGGAFVPLDPEHPSDRLQFMLQDTDARAVISQRHLADKIPTGPDILIIDEHANGLTDESDNNPIVDRSCRDLAYVLYTSGSTGRPKGVMNEHRGIVNRLAWMQHAFELEASDVVLQKTPTSFDVSVWELFWPLLEGARLVIAAPDGHRDTQYLTSLIKQHQVTTVHFVPSMLQLFVEDSEMAACRSLTRVICSGEALPRELQDRFFERLTDTGLHNLYGPTEAAIDVSWWPCDPASTLDTVPIGRTIANTQLHVLDAQLQPVPMGVSGELHIGGVQVARGYLNREQLTAEKFIADPFTERTDERLYKTGDLARFMPDGNIEYLGRLDFQVKIRGFRIELGEIEVVLAQHARVRECVVVAREDRAGDKKLVAYFVGQSNAVADHADITSHLAEHLASYMVPPVLIQLDKLPLSTAGKVDRKALPAPELTVAVDAIAPRHETEEKIALVWQQVLGLDRVGVSDTFFDLGGNSLLLIRLANGLSEAMNRQVAIAELLRFTTIEQQASLLSGSDQPESGVKKKLTSVGQAAQQQRRALAARRRRRPPGVSK